MSSDASPMADLDPKALEAAWTDFLDANPDGLTSPEDLPNHALMTCDQFVRYALSALPPVELITAMYTNWRGERAPRTFIPHRVFFGSNEWHPTPQVLIEATDCVTGEQRTFAASGFAPPPVEAAQEPVAWAKTDVTGKPSEWTTSAFTASVWREQGYILKEFYAAPATGWRTMESAPKDGTRILAWCEHDADPYHVSETSLTAYGAHCEGLSHVEDGYHVIAWGGGSWESTDEYGSGLLIPDWWFRAGSEWEEVANPVKWMPLPPPLHAEGE